VLQRTSCVDRENCWVIILIIYDNRGVPATEIKSQRGKGGLTKMKHRFGLIMLHPGGLVGVGVLMRYFWKKNLKNDARKKSLEVGGGRQGERVPVQQ